MLAAVPLGCGCARLAPGRGRKFHGWEQSLEEKPDSPLLLGQELASVGCKILNLPGAQEPAELLVVMLTAASQTGTGLLQGNWGTACSPHPPKSMDSHYRGGDLGKASGEPPRQGDEPASPQSPSQMYFWHMPGNNPCATSPVRGDKKLQSQLQRWPRFGREGSGCKHKQAVINRALLPVDVESLPSCPWKSNYLQFVNGNLEKPEALEMPSGSMYKKTCIFL